MSLLLVEFLKNLSDLKELGYSDAFSGSQL